MEFDNRENPFGTIPHISNILSNISLAMHILTYLYTKQMITRQKY